MSHTPGPWRINTVGVTHYICQAAVEEPSDGKFDIVRVGPQNYHPDGFPAANREAADNARLIAAAPALLAALKAFAELDDWGKATPDMLRAADAAIRAAEGQS